jgi:SAM-dependent methyltransferase
MQRDIWRCRECDQIVVPEGIAHRADGNSIYESQDSIFEADGNAAYYLDETSQSAAHAKLAYVERFCAPGRRLLDVGACYGHFVAAASTKFNASGVEVSPIAVDWGRQAFGVDVTVGSVYELSKRWAGACEAITLWDVIEHLEDPSRAIQEIHRSLSPRGWLFLSTPDAGSLTAKFLGRRWHYLDPIQHINLFSRANLLRLLSDHGFTVEHYRYFGREYRVTYVLNRLRYLRRPQAAVSRAKDNRLLSFLKNQIVPIKLWDVIGIAAYRND